MMRANVTVDDKVIVVRGYVRDVLRGAGLKPMYAGDSRGWVLDHGRLPDTLAALELAGFTVTVRTTGGAR